MAAAAAAGTVDPGRLSLYFCGSIRGGREDRELYVRIVSRLRRFGVVLTEHVAAAEVDESGEEAAGGDKLIHDRDLAWLQQADVVVAEVTQPSLGVGYELGRAVALHKPVLCLFRPKSGRALPASCPLSRSPHHPPRRRPRRRRRKSLGPGSQTPHHRRSCHCPAPPQTRPAATRAPRPPPPPPVPRSPGAWESAHSTSGPRRLPRPPASGGPSTH
uniref:2'-deoxynucleoside 5'-phosphate N-hydrolase 1 n=1 Tax=Bos taurus TaxID=9913 RepID=E1BM28_BOVIN